MTFNNEYSGWDPLENSSHIGKASNPKITSVNKTQQKPKTKRLSFITKIKTSSNVKPKNSDHAPASLVSLSQVMTPPSCVPSKRKSLSKESLETPSEFIPLSSDRFSSQTSTIGSHPPKKKKESLAFSPRSPTSPTSNQVCFFPGIPFFKESNPLTLEDPPVPLPPVSIFPLFTTPWMPEAHSLIPLIACMDCSALFHHDRYLTCNSCAESHHFHCTSLNICSPPPNPNEPWICINCTFCLKCNQSTPRAQLVKCEKCLSVFHSDCIQVSPKLLHTGGTIFCHDCTSCYSCGLRPTFSASIAPPFWQLHPIKTAYHCQPCAMQYLSGNFCLVCFKVYSEVDADASWVGCDGPCGKWVHKSCDPSLAYLNDTDLKSSSRQYFCPNCSSSTTTTTISTTTSTTPTSCTTFSSAPPSPSRSSIPSSTSFINPLLYSTAPSCTPDVLSLSRSTSHSSLSNFKEASSLMQLLKERVCAFCNLSDHHPIAGRLIYLGGDLPEAFQRLGGLWAHVGCIHWATTTVDSKLQVTSILAAWSRSKDLICQFCELPHANVQCPLPNCSLSFHYPCIVLQNQEYMTSSNTPKKKIHLDLFKKRFRCPSHLSPAYKASISPKEHFDLLVDMRLQLIQDVPFPIRLSTLAVSDSLLSSDPHLPNQFFSLSPSNSRLCIMIGAAIITYLGRFPFEHIDKLVEEIPNASSLLIPIGYTVIRRFWSYRNPGSVTFFTIQKLNLNSNPLFSCMFDSSASSLYPNMSEEGTVISSDEPVDPNPLDHFQIPDSADLGWRITIQDDPLNPLHVSRLQDIVPSLLSRFDPPIPISKNHHYLIHPDSFLLLHHPTIVSFIESLPYAAQSKSYSFRFYDTQALESRRHFERQWHRTCSRTYPLSFTLRFHRPSSPVLSSSNPLVEKKGLEETPSSDLSLCSSLHLYQNMKKNINNFFVKPSKVHGLGLFSSILLHPGDMVIEYVGEIVGQHVADQRDLRYEVQGRGTYFFALEYDRIIDATVVGNRSRYINHSCSPNCEARVISIEGKKKVIIFAIQKIQPSEEITFDYKFKLEASLEKRIKCHCKAENCRKFMN